MTRARNVAAALAAALALSACSGAQEVATTSTSPPAPATLPATAAPTPVAPAPEVTAPPSPVERPAAPPPPGATLQQVRLAAEPYGLQDVTDLTGMATRPGDPALYVITQFGSVWRVVDGVRSPTPVLDLTQVVNVDGPGSERGLLGIAFDPLDTTRMYLYYTAVADGATNVVSYAVGPEGVAQPDSRREVLLVPQPGLGHKAGHMEFDAAGNLFVAIGDGGGSNGRDAQDMTKLLGSIVRITPNRDAPGYTVPPDNPWVGQAGVAPELWAKGLRNPWRFSIDEPTGDMFISDVGNSEIEEINLVPAGQSGLNFGWYFYEGTRRQSSDTIPEGRVLTPPIFEYSHDVGPVVIGGHVYRGAAIPNLQGAYLFADIGGTTWARGSDQVVELPVELDGTVTAFGELPDGELVVLTLYDGMYRLVPA